jgi:response regulator RpfG family c-di-GMP phosphodiesterase
MNERILCIDDEPCILQAYQRALHNQFVIEGALGGEEALKTIAQKGPYAVIVADMRMPGMNGAQVLAKVKEMAPESVRMMLTGNADQQTALDAVNEGHIFRFMTKPCPPDIFGKALKAGLAQYRLIMAEKELLSQTVSGSIKVMTDVLGLVNPAAFSRASRVHGLVRQICRDLGLRRAWLIEIAAMLSQIGCVAIPEKLMSKIFTGQELTFEEEEIFSSHPQTAKELLMHIPRLEEAVAIIIHQNDLYQNETDSSLDFRVPEDVLGSYILKLALDWDALVSSGKSNDLAMAEINSRLERYHPDAVVALRKVMKIADMRVLKTVHLKELADGVVLADDIYSNTGTLLCARGQEVTPSMRARLNNYAVNVGIHMEIKILAPVTGETLPEYAV